jgi:drug/metabolite transporter (DMT)-like permease
LLTLYFDQRLLKCLAASVITLSGWMFCILYSISYTNIIDVLLFGNCQVIFLMVFKWASKQYFPGSPFRRNLIKEEIISLSLSVLGLVLLFLFMEPLSMPSSIYKIHEASTTDRFLHGNLVALLGSLCSAVSVENSKALLEHYSQNFIYFNISSFGILVFLALGLLSDFAVPGSPPTSLLNAFSPGYPCLPNH